MGRSSLQSVPHHDEFLRKPKNESRRNIAHCKFSKHIKCKTYMCTCEQNDGYREKECHSSRNCDYYQDKRI